MIINAPVIDAMIPKMHLGPIFSPRKRKAPEVVKTGFMSVIAVASANPTFEMLKIISRWQPLKQQNVTTEAWDSWTWLPLKVVA